MKSLQQGVATQYQEVRRLDIHIEDASTAGKVPPGTEELLSHLLAAAGYTSGVWRARINHKEKGGAGNGGGQWRKRKKHD